MSRSQTSPSSRGSPTMRRMKRYIYQLKTWPHFTWDHLRLAEPLARVHHEQGRLPGRMEGLGFPLQQEGSC